MVALECEQQEEGWEKGRNWSMSDFQSIRDERVNNGGRFSILHCPFVYATGERR
jgi:hypothetical protein